MNRTSRVRIVPSLAVLLWCIVSSAWGQDRPVVGRAFTLSFLGMEMRPIPAGTFMMGSPDDEPGRSPEEGPLTRVTLSKPFWLGRTDVTYGQWKRVMGTDLATQVTKALQDDTLYLLGGKMETLRDHWKLPREADPAQKLFNTDDSLPMHYVNWNEAMEFCRKVNEQARKEGVLPEGYEYTLPSEAQWEYACRAGTAAATYAGPIQIPSHYNAPVLDAIAWYGGNSSMGYQGTGFDTSWMVDKPYPGGNAGPRDVGLKKPNAWGLYDMEGGVFQWCRDWQGTYPGGQVTDPVGASSDARRARRGGGWLCYARFCRAAYRDGQAPGYRYYDVGFRLALAPIVVERKGELERTSP